MSLTDGEVISAYPNQATIRNGEHTCPKCGDSKWSILWSGKNHGYHYPSCGIEFEHLHWTSSCGWQKITFTKDAQS